MKTPIFVFDDYVDYLSAWYAYARRFRLTQSDFVQRAGVGTQAYFSAILARRKKLAPGHIAGFAAALDLTGDAAEFFSLLVQKEHAAKGPEKEQALKQLSYLRGRNLSTLITDANAEYFSSWKYPVVREYIISRGHVASLQEIKRAFLHFSMPLDEVRRTIDKLLQWKMVIHDPQQGGFRPGPGQGTVTYSGMPHAVVNDVKRLFIESSVHAMETLPRETRHITMAVRGISREKYKQFCRKIDELRGEFLVDEDRAGGVEYVYGLNVQFFPLMKVTADGADPGDGDNKESSAEKDTVSL